MPLKLCVSAFSAGESPLYTALLCVQHVGCYNLCEKQNSCLCRLISVIGVMTLFDWVTIADASYSRQIFTLNYSRPEILHFVWVSFYIWGVWSVWHIAFGLVSSWVTVWQSNDCPSHLLTWQRDRLHIYFDEQTLKLVITSELQLLQWLD